MRLSPAVRYAGGRVLRAAATPRGAAQWLRDRAAYQRCPARSGCAGATPSPSSPTGCRRRRSTRTTSTRTRGRRGGSPSGRPARHVDVGSRVDLVGFLTAITEVTFVDIRPLEVDIEGLTPIAGSVLDLPFEDGALESVSCLHVAEHIGLGRYGDPLDPRRHAQGGGGARARARARRPAAVLAAGRPAARGLQRAPRARPARGRVVVRRARAGRVRRRRRRGRRSAATARSTSSWARTTPAACISWSRRRRCARARRAGAPSSR